MTRENTTCRFLLPVKHTVIKISHKPRELRENTFFNIFNTLYLVNHKLEINTFLVWTCFAELFSESLCICISSCRNLILE